MSWSRAVFVVVIVALAVFANAAFCGWSGWDDPLYILGNPRILATDPGSLLNLWSFEDAHAGRFIEYFPLRDSLYWVIHRIFGINPTPYHVATIFFHALSSALVVVLGQRFSFSVSASLLAGLIFAVHPVHCESVVWISGLKDPMFTSFLLMSIILYEPSENGKRYYIPSVICFAVSMLCKSIGFMLPVMLLVFEWRRHELTLTSALVIVPFGLMSMLFLCNFVLIGRSNNVIIERWGDGWIGSILTSLWCVVMYISLQILPAKLYFFHIIPPITSLSDVRGLTAVAIFISLIIGSIGVAFKNRTVVLLILWFIVFLLPVLNIVPIPVLVAERYLYLPSVAFALGIGAGLTWLIERSRVLGVFAVGVVLIGLAARTVVRNEDWRSGDVALWQGVVTQPTAEVFDSCWMLLGSALLQQKRGIEAEEALLKAVLIQEENNVRPQRRALTHTYLGIEYLEARRLDLAREHLHLALGFDAVRPDAWNSLSITEALSGNPAAAEHAANMAVQLDPNFGNARYNRGLARLDLNRVDEGVADLAAAVVAEPALCPKLGLWLKAVGETPLSARVRAEALPRCQ